MADIQFGWSMPSGPREASHRASFVADLQRGLELIAEHNALSNNIVQLPNHH